MKQLITTLFIFVYLLTTEVSGQCTGPAFTTNDTIGCVPHKVKAINLSECAPRYNFGFGRDTVSSHIYTTPGIYYVYQEVGTGQVYQSDTIKIRAVSNNAPKFKINYCKDRIVKLTFSEDNLYDKYVIDYGDGSPLDTISSNEIPEKQYATDDQKTMTVRGIYNYALCSGTTNKSVFPQNNLSLPRVDTITTTNLSNDKGRIQLKLNASSFFGYQVYLSSNNLIYDLIDTVNVTTGDTIITINQLNTLENSYCVFFTTYDFCGNTKTSDTLCSLSLLARPENNQNIINWSAYPKINKITDYTLLKNDTSFTFNKNDTSFTDTTVICANNYCYTAQVSPNSASNTVIISNTNCVESVSTDTPLPIQNFQSSVSDSQTVALNWMSPFPYLVFSTTIQHATQPSNFSYLANTTNFDTSYSHTSTISSPMCYLIDYTDACNNNSDKTLSDTTCTVFLQATKLQDTEYQLSWTDYLGFNSKTYSIQYLDKNDNVALEKPVTSGLSFLDNAPLETFQKLRYRIKVTSNQNQISYSNTVAFELKSRIFIPNAFSPDGDDLNDYFKPDTRFIKSYTLSIFNRWGELIFYEQDSQNGWNGFYKGSKAPTGTYVFLLEGVDFYDNIINKKGTVTVYY